MRRRSLLQAIGMAVIAAGCGGTSSDVPPATSQGTTPTQEGPATVVMGDFS